MQALAKAVAALATSQAASGPPLISCRAFLTGVMGHQPLQTSLKEHRQSESHGSCPLPVQSFWPETLQHTSPALTRAPMCRNSNAHTEPVVLPSALPPALALSPQTPSTTEGPHSSVLPCSSLLSLPQHHLRVQPLPSCPTAQGPTEARAVDLPPQKRWQL